MHASHVIFIDIGNTNTKVALWSPEAGPFPVATLALPTVADSPDAWAQRLLHAARVWDVDTRRISGVAGCSVVPAVVPHICEAAERAFGVSARFATDHLPLPFDNIADVPDNVGPDRLVAAYGARRMVDSRNLVVVDFGTATTVDCVQGNTFLGGVICPGMESAAKALSCGTARLPELTLDLPGEEFSFSFDTMHSLNQGFIFGFAAMIEGLITRMTGALGGGGTVLATGGLAQSVARVCPSLDIVRPDLLFCGLAYACMDESPRF